MTIEHSRIIMRPTTDLIPATRNARTHSKKQLRKIADSISRFGFVCPILIDREHRVVAGHGRLAAAAFIKLATVPTLTIDHLSPAELRAYAIADNRLAELAGWDREMLSIELAELAILAPEIDLTATGFDLEEIALLNDVAGSQQSSEAEEAPSICPERAVCAEGDLWLIGPHKLLCANALDPTSYKALLGRELADMIITDPPFNVPIAGHVSGLGRKRHREFVMASGEMSREQFSRFLSEACRNMARFSRSGSLHYIFMDWRSISDLMAVGEEHYAQLLNLIVWNKGRGGMGSLYRSQHELVALFKNGRRSHQNNVALGANGRNRTNVWDYAGANSFSPEREQDLARHPTAKNLDMIADAIRDVTNLDDVVLDPFGGSGTGLIAAHDCQRRARMMELDPLYCDVIIRRAQGRGLDAIHSTTGERFEDLERKSLYASHNTQSLEHSTAPNSSTDSQLLEEAMDV